MGFDGASTCTFSVKKSGVQTKIKKLVPHAFVHCQCHLAQLACVQTANSSMELNVYVTMQALDLPELKIVKPSDARWLAHERCVKSVTASYGAIVAALNNTHKSTHEPEALGLSTALSNQYTVVAMYILDCVLPQVATLSRTLQTEHLDLSVVSSLVNATLNTLDYGVLPSANWVLELLDECKHLERSAGITVTQAIITTFQEVVAKAIYHTPEREHF